MEMKRIRYKINNLVNESGFDRVRGYAVNTDLCPVKFCIRQVNTLIDGNRVFVADDFNTGWRISELFQIPRKTPPKPVFRI